jgi:hypothetical protein
MTGSKLLPFHTIEQTRSFTVELSFRAAGELVLDLVDVLEGAQVADVVEDSSWQHDLDIVKKLKSQRVNSLYKHKQPASHFKDPDSESAQERSKTSQVPRLLVFYPHMHLNITSKQFT